MELARARALGMEAFEQGKGRAPILHAEIHNALRGLRVGDGGAAIMNAYTDGYDFAESQAEPLEVCS